MIIGDIVVHKGTPPQNNPYRGFRENPNRPADEPCTHVSGDERVAALQAFKDGDDTSGYTFWHAPATGWATQLTTTENVDWTGLR